MNPTIALDLGSTSIKAGSLRDDGTWQDRTAVPAPPIDGTDAVRESDPDAYLAAAERALGRVLPKGAGPVRLGIASQRSSFVLWDARTGTARTPLISWQDRRAADFCARHPDLPVDATGLLLSPHYAGPKLAALFDAEPALRAAAARGELRFGTLDTWLAWRWSGGLVHRTDVTMAARTLLLELGARDWSPTLLDAFGVPRAILPRITGNAPEPVEMLGRRVELATIADQQAGATAALATGGDTLVNFGTGTFVLRATGTTPRRRRGYLTGPLVERDAGAAEFLIEGTINAGGAVADRFAPGPVPIPDRDEAPDALCLPDANGIGAPHWRADLSFVASLPTERLAGHAGRRLVLEGLVFRVREILDDLFDGDPPDGIVLAGGLTREPFLAHALASCLGHAVAVDDDAEASLQGAVRRVGGAPKTGARRRVEPLPGLAWLPAKYERWRAWVAATLR